MPDLVTKTIKNVELMAAGTWQGHNCPEGGCKIGGSDLDDMVSAYQALGDQVNAPVKLGHNDGQELIQKDGLPAAGWVTNLRRQGNTLVGDLEGVPLKVADLMKAGGYRKRSAEITPNMKIGGKTYPNVFTGLALLGNELPAVTSLDDITSLYHSLDIAPLGESVQAMGFEVKDEVLEFDSPALDDVDSIIEALEGVVKRAEAVIAGKKGSPALRSLIATTKQQLRRVASKQMSKEDNEMDEAELRTLLGIAEDADIKAHVDGLKAAAAVKPEGLNAEDKAELSKLRGEVIVLQTNSTKATAYSLVDAAIKDGKLLPAQREQSLAFALADSEGFEKFVKDQPNLIEFKERGSANAAGINGIADAETIATLEPTDAEKLQAKQLNLDWTTHRISLMRTKAEAKGIALPADFGKETTKA